MPFSPGKGFGAAMSGSQAPMLRRRKGGRFSAISRRSSRRRAGCLRHAGGKGCHRLRLFDGNIAAEGLRPETRGFRVLFPRFASGLDDAPALLVMTGTGALTLADLMMGGEGKDLPAEASELFLMPRRRG